MNRRGLLIITALALVWGGVIALLVRQPGYTDAYYYFNAGQRLAQGDGLTDTYLWTYISAPDTLPGPSHSYWMPLESLVAAGSMVIFGAHFGAAQLPSVLCFGVLVALAFWLGETLGGSRRTAWLAGLLVLFSGFYTPFWATTDTFALYGAQGALALVALGQGRLTGRWFWYAASGGLAALAHLTRADGVLFLMVAVIVAWWPGRGCARKTALVGTLAAVLAYGIVMLPWFVRNWHVLGAVLPVGGTDTIWMRGYDEIMNYPPGSNAAEFWSWGLDNIVRSRLEALANNLGTFIAVETWVVLGPFAVGAAWVRRREPRLSGAIWYAIGLHLAMTFVFAFPGYRGGLFHSSAALLPFWAVLGVLGLDDGIRWMARKRKWHRAQAQTVFGGAVIVLAVCLSVGILIARLKAWNTSGEFYDTLAHDLPPDAVIMSNDPAALYYHTGLGGVVVPNAVPDAVIPEIAVRYGVTHVLLDVNRPAPFTGLFLGEETSPFLRLVIVYDAGTDDQSDDHRLFEIVLEEQTP